MKSSLDSLEKKKRAPGVEWDGASSEGAQLRLEGCASRKMERVLTTHHTSGTLHQAHGFVPQGH